MSKFNFFDKISVSTVNFADHVVNWSFNSAGLMLLNESTTAGRIVEYSFDGENLAGDLDPSLPSAGIAFDNRHENRIYFRLKTAGTAAIMRVEAWA